MATRKWPARLELALFEAMARVRPVGMHRHFAIIDIARSLQDLAPEITPAMVWAHLSTMYNLEALNENESDEIAAFVHGDSDDEEFQEYMLPLEPGFESKMEVLRTASVEANARAGVAATDSPRGRGSPTGRPSAKSARSEPKKRKR
eukprot:m.5357 g.5357  ORF g.5357 m.5357 type:complete len:147 (+) comp4514_c0_seq1:1-441(+)